ncbi:putative membrane protein [Saliterribacillus persicus]|uniref:Putative membrane protein n=2 Tax=Saliterribacillus persicus TaxID=930114 RepID=A0A368XY82_9BACI|nr:putative membrane protein [Saliterribacillus persicus]
MGELRGMEWKNIFRGLLMGASDIIPGVSGGTIAVVLGIYDRLIEAINGFFSKDWKKHMGFLLPLGIGIVTVIFALANVIEWLFEHFPGPTQFGFLGLILGVIPFLLKKSDAKNTFKMQHLFLLIVGTGLVASMVFFHTGESDPVTSFSTMTYVWLFISGFIASSAMILPGISGSFLLLVLGAYTTIISAVKNLDLPVIMVVGVGIVLGIIVMSKIIHFFLKHYEIATFAVVTGMVLGSVVVIFPGWPVELAGLLLSITTFAIGLLVAYLLGKVEYS